MKQILYLSTILLFVISCENSPTKNTETVSNTEISFINQKDTTFNLKDNTDTVIDKKTMVFKSDLRPGKTNWALNERFIDTLELIEYNNDYDYKYLLFKNAAGKEVSIYLAHEIGYFEVNKNYSVGWKVSKFEEAGDENATYYKEQLTSFEIINTQEKEFAIYRLTPYEKTNKKETGFISLTDSYDWNDHPDSLAISTKYFGSNEYQEHHVLSSKYRKRFLYKVNIKETDKVFIYNYSLDTIFTFSVEDLPLLAHVTVYGPDQPVNQHNYLIGFDTEGKCLDKPYNNFVYIGKTNPFATGNLKPIIWKKIEDYDLPSISEKSETYKRLKNYKSLGVYKFTDNNLSYYLEDYEDRARQLVVISDDNQIVFNSVAFAGESLSLAPISFFGEKREYGHEQWTGKILKDKPPVMFGFSYHSFGCQGIDVLSKSEKTIRILCDNRH